MTSTDILQQLKDDETQILEAFDSWMRTVKRAGDFWKGWRAGWKAALDRAAVLLDRADVLEEGES